MHETPSYIFAIYEYRKYLKNLLENRTGDFYLLLYQKSKKIANLVLINAQINYNSQNNNDKTDWSQILKRIKFIKSYCRRAIT